MTFSLKRNVNKLTKMEVHSRDSRGRTYQCNNCKKALSSKNNLAKHRRIHAIEKPYQCSHCKKVFSLKANLTTHQRTHTREKPYQCSHCSKGVIRCGPAELGQKLNRKRNVWSCRRRRVNGRGLFLIRYCLGCDVIIRHRFCKWMRNLCR